MIQRKQTLFLMLAVCAMITCCFAPIATFTGTSPLGQTVSGELRLFPQDHPEMADQILNADHVEIGQRGFVKTWPLMVLTLLIAVLSQVCVFLYKNRKLQLRIVAFGFLLGVLDLFLIFIWAVDALVDGVTQCMALENVDVTYHAGTWCTVACVVFLFLSQRSIKKDEALVHSADRLR